MGIHDRDWYREEQRQARNGNASKPARRPVQSFQNSQSVDWQSYFAKGKRPTTPSQITFRAFGVFVLLCLAVFGALSLLQHFRGQTAKPVPPTVTPSSSPPTPKPAPEYHIKRAPTV